MKTLRSLLIIVALLLSSCQYFGKKVWLPKLENVPIKQVEDYSTIYVFYDKDTRQYELNKNNLITSTHWVFNMDGRLSMAQASEVLDQMQTKKESPSMHNKPDSHNFFSVADTQDNSLAFIDFTPTRFRTSLPNSELSGLVRVDKNNAIYEGKVMTLNGFIKNHYSQKTIWNFDSAMTLNDFLYLYKLLSEMGIQPTEIFVTQ